MQRSLRISGMRSLPRGTSWENKTSSADEHPDPTAYRGSCPNFTSVFCAISECHTNESPCFPPGQVLRRTLSLSGIFFSPVLTLFCSSREKLRQSNYSVCLQANHSAGKWQYGRKGVNFEYVILHWSLGAEFCVNRDRMLWWILGNGVCNRLQHGCDIVVMGMKKEKKLYFIVHKPIHPYANIFLLHEGHTIPSGTAAGQRKS